jgi:serine/threonine protein phosphatase PrpC
MTNFFACSTYVRSTSTTAVVWTQNNRNIYLQVANLGDSTAYLLNGQECVQLTVDHNPTQQSERDRIQAMGVTLGEHQTRYWIPLYRSDVSRVEGGLSVSRAFGDFECKVGHTTGLIGTPEISDAVLIANKTSRLIIASDGVCVLPRHFSHAFSYGTS